MYFILQILRSIYVPYFVILSCCYLLIKFRYCQNHNFPVGNVSNILVVTAHPDDECMFFSPTIIGLLKSGLRVHLLCLTSGNFYGLGEKRKAELSESCRCLGLSDFDINLVDDSRFPDNPEVEWNVDDLKQAICDTVIKLRVDSVITFDDHGVSSHSNHIALNHAVRKLCKGRVLPNGTRVYILESTGVLRKYSSFLDLPVTYFTSQFFFLSSLRGVMKGWNAMYRHRSQFVWFRVLYILFSRYMIMNSLTELPVKYRSLRR